MFKPGTVIANGLVAGDTIYLDPHALPKLKIITKEEADKIADAQPKREFVVSWDKK